MKTTTEPALSVRGLSCHYKGAKEEALSNLNFELPMGETVALLGPNGAGKSTLMKCILGLIDPSVGSVELFGKPVADQNGAFRTVGFTSDEDIYNPNAKVKELFAFELRAQQISGTILADIEAQTGLSSFWNKKLKSLSTGQRQKTLINLALLSNPPILMLDEPANGLDIEALSWLHDLVNKRKDAGLLTIISSHNLAELKDLASKVLVIKRTLRYQGDFFPGSISLEELRNTYLQIVEGHNA